MSECTSQRLGKHRRTTRQARSSGGREEDKVLKVGHERAIDAPPPDGVKRGFLDPIKGAGELQRASKQRRLRLFLGSGPQFQCSGGNVSKNLLLKDERFSDRARRSFRPVLFEARLCSQGQSRNGYNYPHAPLWILKWRRIR